MEATHLIEIKKKTSRLKVLFSKLLNEAFIFVQIMLRERSYFQFVCWCDLALNINLTIYYDPGASNW